MPAGTGGFLIIVMQGISVVKMNNWRFFRVAGKDACGSFLFKK
jgi:hypothetical protein